MQIARDKHADYRKASPFPHIYFDGLFPDDLLGQALVELPGASAGWVDYNNADEKKQVCSDTAAFGPAAETIAHALNSAAFVRFVEELTGISGLIPDPHLRSAGYMRVPPGGHLGLHYDFMTQKELKLERRVNVLLYLNRDWQTEWGGQLELHSNDDLDGPAHCQVDIEPLFNRVAVFNTRDALHGHRRQISCPEGRARICLSVYYYTAPPVLGWESRERGVSFAGRFDLKRAATVAANLFVPPIFLGVVRSAVCRLEAYLRGGVSQAQHPAAEPSSLPVPALPTEEIKTFRPAWWRTDLLDYTNDVIIVWEMSDRGVVYWNRAAELLYGYGRAEAQGKETHNLLRTKLAGGIGDLEKKLAQYGVWVGMLRHRTRDGREVTVEGRLALLSQENGRWLVLEVNREVTDSQAARAARRTREQKVHSVQDSRLPKPAPDLGPGLLGR